jgi:hypothetical protein
LLTLLEHQFASSNKQYRRRPHRLQVELKPARTERGEGKHHASKNLELSTVTKDLPALGGQAEIRLPTSTTTEEEGPSQETSKTAQHAVNLATPSTPPVADDEQQSEAAPVTVGGKRKFQIDSSEADTDLDRPPKVANCRTNLFDVPAAKVGTNDGVFVNSLLQPSGGGIPEEAEESEAVP